MTQQRIPAERIARFTEALLKASGVNDAQIASVTRNIIWNELVGRSNFGLNRLPILLKRVEAGVMNANSVPSLTQLTPSSASLNGDNGFGQFVGEQALQHAIARAKTHGVGVCTAHNSNFYGTGAYFVHFACEAGCIGIAMSNSFPKVAAHGGKRPVLGTNPFAFGAPGPKGAHILVDFATSALAGSTIRQLIDDNAQVDAGLAIDEDGNPTRDPADIARGALLPFGGAKGFGLAMMVELLSGVLSGAAVAGEIGSTYHDLDRPANNGHFFLALDVATWIPLNEFFARSEALTAALIGSGRDGDVRLPGARRYQTLEDHSEHGVPVRRDLLNELNALANAHGIQPL